MKTKRVLGLFLGVLLLGQTAYAADGILLRQSDGSSKHMSGTGTFADVNQATLGACEDVSGHACMTEGAAVRTGAFSSVTSAVASAFTNGIPLGIKTFKVIMENATSETKGFVVEIYLNDRASTVGSLKVCTVTVPSTASQTVIADYCPKTDINGAYWYFLPTTYTSASSAPLTVVPMY